MKCGAIGTVTFCGVKYYVGSCFSTEGLWALTLPQKDLTTVRQLLWQSGVEETLSEKDSNRSTRLLFSKLQLYYKDGVADFDYLRLDWRGYTLFQRSVLDMCRSIPKGSTITYGALASKIGRPCSGRAVGNALGINRTPVVIPCHRVILASGSLGGFTGGVHCKWRLLEWERREV